MIQAEPTENELTDNGIEQIKSSDALPPLRVVKKAIEERKENIEPFTTVAVTNGNDRQEVIIDVVKEDVKVILCIAVTKQLFLMYLY